MLIQYVVQCRLYSTVYSNFLTEKMIVGVEYIIKVSGDVIVSWTK